MKNGYSQERLRSVDAVKNMRDALRAKDVINGQPERIEHTLLGGNYRVTRLLYERPRLKLYLGNSVADEEEHVVMRELDGSGLTPRVRAQLEAAIHEEFITPIALGSPHLTERKNRIAVEDGRYYLVLYLHAHGDESAQRGDLLENVLLRQRAWPDWLDDEVALRWGTQLCRIVARLHRLGVVLGDLGPATVLVDQSGQAPWLPVLLPTWPPAPHFWHLADTMVAPQYFYQKTFPIDRKNTATPFVAPEVLHGVCDWRSDIYALGALLYLLLTHYAPVTAKRRLQAASYQELERDVRQSKMGIRATQAMQSVLYQRGEAATVGRDGLELIAPRLLNPSLSLALEQVIVRALALNPARRYPSAFALVEALESV